ncbi:ArgE/DapE family deacylase [Limosilactobacillus oris]|uniref:ArgE/DapE family deacylase n=1 Tax=Limosilactobacillus oris TaxID=1632 RepID=UPI00259AE637|nr:ArgE/DapE family deacylase [Limosilactobacillus oris]
MKKEAQVAILAKLISINSVNGNEAQVADFIESLFQPYGKRVQIDRVSFAPGRDNLVVTIGEGDRTLGFCGHEDVVATDNPDQWTSDPFVATIRNGRLYGRGASDMKSGLAAMLVMMLEMLATDTIPGRIRLFATVGEETGEYGAAQLTKAGYADDLAGLIIGEPTNGLSEVGYTAKGVIDYIVTAIGKQAHSSQPENGINAVDQLVDFASQVRPLMASFNQVNPILGKLTHVQSVFQGGQQVNSVPAKAVIKGNIRTIPEYPNQVIFDALNQLVDRLNQQPQHQLKLQFSYPEEAMPGSKDSALVKLIGKVHEELLASPVRPTGQTSASDGSEFLYAKGNFDIALIGPGNDSKHQTDEYVDLTAFYQASRFYQQLAQDFFA